MELVPRALFEGPEGLTVRVSREGVAVLRCDAHGAHLIPERAVELAFELLGTYAPDTLEAIERAVRAERLRLVQSGAGPEGAA